MWRKGNPSPQTLTHSLQGGAGGWAVNWVLQEDDEHHVPSRSQPQRCPGWLLGAGTCGDTLRLGTSDRNTEYTFRGL